MRSLYASSCPKDEGVPTINQSGRGSWPCRLWGGLDKARRIVPTALLVRVQFLKNDLYKVVEGPSTRPIVLSMITGSYVPCRMRLTILEHDETKFASHLILISLRLYHHRRPGERVQLQIIIFHILFYCFRRAPCRSTGTVLRCI